MKIKEVLTSEKTKESLWKITEYVANGIGIAIPIVAVVLREKKRKHDTYEVDLLSDIFSTANYGNAVSAIMNSSMFDSRKVQVIELLKKDQPQTYYCAVSAIMNSSMLDSRKVQVIELLKKDQPQTYYKAVISIVNSNMFDSRKVEAIEKLNSNE